MFITGLICAKGLCILAFTVRVGALGFVRYISSFVDLLEMYPKT
jgi:hypothetical protein